jgi:hypothetical protein
MAPYRLVARKQTDAKAVLSLFLGLASFVFGPATGIPAIILGSVARRDIDRTGMRGAALARSGTLAGLFGIGFFAVFVLWIGSALLVAPPETAQLNAVTPTSEEAQANAKVTPPATTTPAPKYGTELLH